MIEKYESIDGGNVRNNNFFILLSLFCLSLFLSIDRSGAETINMTLSGDAVCDNATTPTTCEIINITPTTFATGVLGDSFVFDIIINNMEQIKLGSDVFFGLEYETIQQACKALEVLNSHKNMH